MLWRWCRKGLRGAFLQYVRVGSKTSLRRGCGRQVCTTREALLRFFTELAELDETIDAERHARPASLKRSLLKAITSRQRQRALGHFRSEIRENDGPEGRHAEQPGECGAGRVIDWSPHAEKTGSLHHVVHRAPRHEAAVPSQLGGGAPEPPSETPCPSAKVWYTNVFGQQWLRGQDSFAA